MSNYERTRGAGRVAIVGAGPAGLATALALRATGFEVSLFEQHGEVRASGNVINLWPAPQKILRVFGVDMEGMGAAARVELRRFDGRPRATFVIPDDIARRYMGGFVGLLRWDLYRRMSAAVPADMKRFGSRVTGVTDRGDSVTVQTADGRAQEFDLVVGADGINSVVRRSLWGDSPKREHRIHAILGYVYDDAAGDLGIFAHDRKCQGSYTPMACDGKRGYGWWVIEAWEPDKPFTGESRTHAYELVKHFAEPLPTLIRNTRAEHLHRWQIRDRKPLKLWSRGRMTLAGDAAHPTSPYAAYGAGMSIEDGYFLGRALNGLNLTDRDALSAALLSYEVKRQQHTADVSQAAYAAGQMFHHVPRLLRPLRDFVFDHTSLMQKQQGDAVPARSVRQLAAIDGP